MGIVDILLLVYKQLHVGSDLFYAAANYSILYYLVFTEITKHDSVNNLSQDWNWRFENESVSSYFLLTQIFNNGK